MIAVVCGPGINELNKLNQERPVPPISVTVLFSKGMASKVFVCFFKKCLP